MYSVVCEHVVLVPDPKPTPAQIAFSILEVIYAQDEVLGLRLVNMAAQKGLEDLVIVIVMLHADMPGSSHWTAITKKILQVFPIGLSRCKTRGCE